MRAPSAPPLLFPLKISTADDRRVKPHLKKIPAHLRTSGTHSLVDPPTLECRIPCTVPVLRQIGLDNSSLLLQLDFFALSA
jgi:hypothetical protein